MLKGRYSIVVLSLLVIFRVAVSNVLSRYETRIISGTPATKGQFPWHVILKKNEMDELLCGGSIIASTWVLTAAHCTYGLSSVFMIFGTILLDDQTAFNMSSTEIYIHPNYNKKFLNNDVSLIQLPAELKFSRTIKPIALVSSSQAKNSFIGAVAYIAGFGLTDDEYLDYSQKLLWARVEIINNTKCTETFGSDVVVRSTLCAKGNNSTNMSICSGDSGGPLIMRNSKGKWMQIGINSFVAEDQCTMGYPSGYARVTSFIRYISQTTGINFR